MNPRYQPIGGIGKFIKWEVPGETVEGVWRGLSGGKYGAGSVGTVDTDEGTVQFSMTTVLGDRLKDVRVGREIYIEYAGKGRSSKGVEFKTFTVGVVPEDGDPPAPDPAPDDAVPF